MSNRTAQIIADVLLVLVLGYCAYNAGYLAGTN